MRAPAAERLATPLRLALQSVDPNLAAYGVQTLQRSFENERWFLRVFGTLFSVFAGFALLLAAIGIYGIVAYAVTRRTQEIGIRMALGADAKAIRAMLLAHGIKRLAIGLTLGVAAASGAAQAMRQTLVGV